MIEGVAPTEVGSFELVAELSATKEYRAATVSISFAIAPAPTSTTLTVARSGAGATCTVRIEGLYAPEGTVRFTANGYVLGTVAVEGGLDGTYVASLGLDAVPEGDYEVVASFTPATQNYVASRDTRLVHRDALERTIIGTTSYEKTYGDAPFALDLVTDMASDTDVWGYEVVFDGHETLGFESAVSMGEGGLVEVRHAGRSLVCVTLTDTVGVYDEAVALVEVTVVPAELTVTSVAKSGGERVASAAYGTLVDLDYTLDYEGLTKGDSPEDFTHGHGTLEAIPVHADASADPNPYDIAIAQVGASLEVAGRELENVFVARDYRIVYVMGELEVVPATLTVRTESASKSFDGCALTAPGRVEGLVGDETVSLVVTGSQTEVGSSANGYRLTWDGTAKESNYEVREDLGTLTVTQAVVSYFYVGEADPSWTQKSDKALTLTYKRSVLDETTYDHFQDIRVDGVEVADGSFDARKGSVVIDFLPTYLSRLAVGRHVATAVFDDGVAPDVAFFVREAGGGDDPVKPDNPVNPVTPDEPVVPWVPVSPVNPVNPVNPLVPVTPINPYVPVVPDGHKTPETPEAPASPSKPETQPTASVIPSDTSPSASSGSTVASTDAPVATQAPVAGTSVVGGQTGVTATGDAGAAPQRVPATGDPWRWGSVVSLVLAGVGAVTLGCVLRRWRRE